jgi:putative ABC exporter
VIAASLYIIACSARNRARTRLRRLREPRYLLGAIVGIAYLYFSVFARMRTSRASAARRAARGAGRVPPALAALASVAPAFAGLGLLAVTLVSWLVPVNSGLFDFSDAEMQFLFPAPISRRQLLVHRMLRSQLGLLFASVIVGIATPSVAGFTRLRVSIATWLLLVTVKIYFTGITLARAKLLSTSARARRVAWMPVIAVGAAVTIVAVSLARAFAAAPVSGPIDGLTRIGDVATHGAARIVLWPFVAAAAPLSAAWPGPYLSSLATAAALLAATIAWVLQSDQAFEEAVTEAAERRAAEPSAHKPSYRVGWGGWALSAVGRPETAFAWKGAMQTLRVVDRRSVARVAVPLLALTIAAMMLGRSNGLAMTIGLFAMVGTAFSILMAPQALRVDMRQDLRHLELLKTWPVAPAAVVRGELLWPGMLLTASAWTFLGMALLLSGTVFSSLALAPRISGGAAVAIATPALIFAQFTIHNGVALMFPAWVQLGTQRARGLDALGQRLIMLTATWIALVVMILPGAVGGGILWFGFRSVLGSAALVPAALVGAGIVAVEVLLATEALGHAFAQLDVMAVERAE